MAKQNKMRVARAALGLTQEELARRLGYASGLVISHKENGRRPVTQRDVLALRALGYKPGADDGRA